MVNFKIFHPLTSYSTYEYAQKSRHQALQCLNNFNMHTSTIYCPFIDNIDSINSNIKSNKNVLEKYLDAPTLDNHLNYSTITSQCLNLDWAISYLYKSATIFVMSSHNSNKFTLKDVIKIQIGIVEYYIKPMEFILTELNNTQIEHLARKL